MHCKFGKIKRRYTETGKTQERRIPRLGYVVKIMKQKDVWSVEKTFQFVKLKDMEHRYKMANVLSVEKNWDSSNVLLRSKRCKRRQKQQGHT